MFVLLAFIKLVRACVCWTGVGQWATVAGCRSERWTFWLDFLCVLIRERGHSCNPMRAPTHRTNEGDMVIQKTSDYLDGLFRVDKNIREKNILYNTNPNILFDLENNVQQWSVHLPACPTFISPDDSLIPLLLHMLSVSRYRNK